jgi:hypothetical protein
VSGLPEGGDYLETNTSQSGGSIYQDVHAGLSPGQSYAFSAVDAGALLQPQGQSAGLPDPVGPGRVANENGHTCKTLTSKWSGMALWMTL